MFPIQCTCIIIALDCLYLFKYIALFHGIFVNICFGKYLESNTRVLLIVIVVESPKRTSRVVKIPTGPVDEEVVKFRVGSPIHYQTNPKI